MKTANEVQKLMLDAIHDADYPVDVDTFYYQMGVVQFNRLRHHTPDVGDIYLTSSGAWYFRGHRVDVDYDNPDAPVAIRTHK